jgi:succinate-semialdehyde dehydrogenase/glutarate-semialdehyde dehydrogenase
MTKPILSDKTLFKGLAFVGDWCEAASGQTTELRNPTTGEVLAVLPKQGREDTARAISEAEKALQVWQALGVDGRGEILHRWASSMRDHKEDLAKIMTAEMGKPLAESAGETVYASTFIDFFAAEACRNEGELIPAHTGSQRMVVMKQPVGVGAAITPWNFPALMVTRKVGAALAAGCTIVLKPSSLSPLTALAHAELANRAGVPPGVFSVVVGSSSEIGREILENPTVRAISFTGSTAIGKFLMAESAKTVKKIGMELGGNAPFVLFDDADLDAAVDAAVAAKFRNCGQTCVTANRFLVQDSVYDSFVERYVPKVNAITVGNGLEPGTDMGPLIEETAVAKVEEHISDALSKGAKLLTGGKRHALGGTFFEPTVLGEVTSEMLIFRDETFGPVAPIIRFSTEEEGIRLANDTEYGLAAYFYSQGAARCWRVAEALEAGIVCENTVAFSSARAPFGGFKESGVGREGGHQGLDEWQEIKYRCIGGLG